MILQQTIDSVFSKMDIVDVIGQFVNLKKSGVNYKGLSPFTSERTPSFMVSPQKQIFKCFSSGKGGNGINFLMEHNSWTYPEAIKWLCDRYQIEFLETEKTNEEKIYEQQREALFIINEEAKKFFMSNVGLEQLAIIKGERSIETEIAQKFEIGFAPGTVTALCNHLVTYHGYNWELCVQASLIKYRDNSIYDTFRNRLMFPIKDVAGRISGFGGRLVDWQKGHKMAKYLNSSDSLVYNKSNIVYGLFEGKKSIIENNLCYISEGYTDVIGFHCSGVENIVAASGTSFTAEQAKLIRRFTTNVVFLFDGDGPGVSAALRGIDIALAEGLSVKVCVLPNNQDPDDFRKGRTAEQIREYLSANSKDFIVFKLNHLLKNSEDFTERGAAITEVVNSISKIKNPIQREVYLKECSRITDVDIEPLKIMLNQTMNNDQEFFNVNPEEFQISESNNRQYLIEQCEARILQYLLCYKDEVLNFKDVVYVQTNFGLEERVTINQSTVLNEIKKQIVDDGLVFQNMQYSQIFDIAFRSDIRDVNLWSVQFGDELNLIAQRLREQEIATNLTSFAKEGVKTYEYVMKSRTENLQNGLTETLLFFKMLNVEIMVAEMLRQEQPATDDIFELLEFNNNLKEKLNVL